MKPDRGCLSTTKEAGIPDYALNDFEKRALTLALKLVQATPAPEPFTVLQKVDAHLMRMNCYACHEWRGTGGLEEPRAQYLTVNETVAHSLGEIGRLPPKLDNAGRKITSAWMEKLLWGSNGGVRSYMTVRMPRFGRENSEAFLPIFADASKREQPIEMDTSGLAKHHRSELGRVLMGTGVGGLGCISCHGLKDRKSLGVPVINLTQTVKRLQPEYFKELLLNPQVTQPGTLMPPLFLGQEEGRSGSGDALDLSQGDRPVAPAGGAAADRRLRTEAAGGEEAHRLPHLPRGLRHPGGRRGLSAGCARGVRCLRGALVSRLEG